MNKILVFIPTYEELENVTTMCEKIMALPLPLDLLFVDDASPDGTGQELDRLASLHPRVSVRHRAGKLGIGTAHQEGISHAYRNGYEFLITMDCDFTHDPARIPDLINNHEGAQVVLGSRYLEQHSLPGWSRFRKFLTLLGHFLTRHLLGVKYDATGAFRLYDLRTIPASLFQAVRSKSYSFFFESLFVLANNGIRIREIPIILPSRTYGHSKLSFFEAYRSAMFLLGLSIERQVNPGRFQVGRQADKLAENLHDPQDWAPYWQQKKEVSGFIYELIAALYRNTFLRPGLRKALLRTFRNNNSLLHAGCGSGQVDIDLHGHFKITAIDISRDALDLYSRYNSAAFRIEQADILRLPYEDETYDGVYNLGVVEHFSKEDIVTILAEFRRVLKPDGKIVIFWPHRYASSVLLLKTVRWFAKTIWKKELKLHPAEISLLKSRTEAESVFAASKFSLINYQMDLRDGFIQAVLTGQKQN